MSDLLILAKIMFGKIENPLNFIECPYSEIKYDSDCLLTCFSYSTSNRS